MCLRSSIKGIIQQPCESTEIYFQSDKDIAIAIKKIKNTSKYYMKAMLKDVNNDVVAYVFISPGQAKSLAAEEASSLVVQCVACVPQVCPSGQQWDQPTCECVTCPEQPCSVEIVWDPTQVNSTDETLNLTKEDCVDDCNNQSKTNYDELLGSLLLSTNSNQPINNCICKGTFRGNILIS